MKIQPTHIVVVMCIFDKNISYWNSYHTGDRLQITLLLLAVSQAIAYLLYPLLGWLSDVYFTRYKVIRFTFIAMTIGEAMFALVALSILIDEKLAYKKYQQ